MSGIPTDLMPLPTAPYDERPLELALDTEECRTALWRCRGNISDAAKLLKVGSSRLRAYVRASPYLTREIEEAREQVLDRAEDVVWDALNDENRCDQMARFVLQTLGKSRGYGNGSGGVSVNLPKGDLVIKWADGSTLSVADDAKTIEHEVIDVG